MKKFFLILLMASGTIISMPAATDKSVEWLKYEFLNETEISATIALSWEKLMIPFKIEVEVDEQHLLLKRKAS